MTVDEVYFFIEYSIGATKSLIRVYSIAVNITS